jgi:hypothetical protein
MGGWIDSLWIPKITISTGQYNKAKKFIKTKDTEFLNAIAKKQTVFFYHESVNLQKVLILTLTKTLRTNPN